MNAVNPQPLPLPAEDRRLAQPMQELMARVLREARERQFNQLMFVGVARRVGASFITQQAAEELAAAFGQVLVVEVSEQAPAGEGLEGDLDRLCSPGRSVARVGLSLADALRLFGIGNADTEALFERLNQRFALVLWDMPPPTQSPVAMVAAKCMSGVVLVAQANRTRRQVAQYAARRLQESGGELLGLVLNRSLNFIPDWLYRWL
ncbi:hypothetical protein [Pseudomonas sp. Gutcm_11s]|uniref:hypothetical protein n=1 Tax=Pseudomonas sp. Gutcm_11s TaxID=3026088 RepID=UPI00235FB724|nr:hypothetical protein [Pseudomonas sp. Gutcm_11s]MDD0841196.1 hypothetical protein [Pseudomonas sp. Gutcm_11s]